MTPAKTPAKTAVKMDAPLMNAQGQETGRVQLPEKVFGRNPSPEFLHEYVTVYLNNQRGFNAHTKTRSEVSGGGKKPWKQKHTGRARAGSTRSPLWRHGGVVFGPRSGRVRLETTRRKANLALAQALSARFKEGAVVFVEGFSLTEPKTKEMAAVLKRLGGTGRMLVIIDRPDPKIAQASRNLPQTTVLLAGDLNAYEVLRSRRLFMTRTAVEKLSARSN